MRAARCGCNPRFPRPVLAWFHRDRVPFVITYVRGQAFPIPVILAVIWEPKQMLCLVFSTMIALTHKTIKPFSKRRKMLWVSIFYKLGMRSRDVMNELIKALSLEKQACASRCCQNHWISWFLVTYFLSL